MFKITGQQMLALRSSCARSFEQQMVRLLEGRFPEQCAAMGPARLLGMVQDGIARAALYELTSEKRISRFLGLLCALGENFDRDPELPWAAELFEAAGARPAFQLLDELSQAAPSSAPGDDAEHSDAGAEPAAAQPRATDEAPLSGRIDVGQPATPCMEPLRRRNLLFSA